MTGTLTAHLVELAEALHDLRCRLRQTARIEVARTIGESLREATLAMICGPVRYPSTARTGDSAWDDPWQDSATDAWDSPSPIPPEVVARAEHRVESMTLPPALVAGLGAARWGFVRTRQMGPALLIGLLVALAAHAGGPTVKTLLETWSAASDLLSYPGSERRP